MPSTVSSRWMRIICLIGLYGLEELTVNLWSGDEFGVESLSSLER